MTGVADNPPDRTDNEWWIKSSRAVGMVEKALRLITEEGKQTEATQIERRLELYKAKQPYREP